MHARCGCGDEVTRQPPNQPLPDDFFAECHRLPSCDGSHHPSVCERVQRENAALAAVDPSGDHMTGWGIVIDTLTMLQFVVRSDGAARCWKCGRIGPYCGVEVTVAPDEHGNLITTFGYCALD